MNGKVLSNDGKRATIKLANGNEHSASRGIGQTAEDFLRGYPVGATITDLDPDYEETSDGEPEI